MESSSRQVNWIQFSEFNTKEPLNIISKIFHLSITARLESNEPAVMITYYEYEIVYIIYIYRQHMVEVSICDIFMCQ